MGKVVAHPLWGAASTQSSYSSDSPYYGEPLTEKEFIVSDTLDQENPSWFTPILRKYFELEFLSAEYQGEPVYQSHSLSAVAFPGQVQVAWVLKPKFNGFTQVEIQLTSEDKSTDFDVIGDHGSIWGKVSEIAILWAEGVPFEDYDSLREGWSGSFGDFIEMTRLIRR